MAITLQAARVNAGLKQTEVAAKLGITPETLSRWEKGKSYPNVLQITELEKLYHISYADINFLPTKIGLTDEKNED